MVYRLRHLIGSSSVSTPQGRAVPLPYYEGLLGRARAALAVLKGKAVAVKWPKEGEFEEAVNQ